MKLNQSMLRWTIGVIAMTSALVLCAWPANTLAWSVTQDSSRGSECILCIDEAQHHLLTIHSRSSGVSNSSKMEMDLRRYDLLTGRQQSMPLPRANLEIHNQIKFCENRSLYACWSTEKPEISIYAVNSESPHLSFTPVEMNPTPSQGPGKVAWSPDGALLVAKYDKEVYVWNIASGQLQGRFVPPPRTQNDSYQGNSSSLETMSISADNHFLAVSGDGIAVYDLHKKYLVGQIPKFGIPRFVDSTRIAVLPRRGEKQHAEYYAIGEELVTAEDVPIPLPVGEVAVSNNSRCYFTVNDFTGYTTLRTSLPSWVPVWINQKWVEWLAKGSITLNLKGYDIRTKQLISQQSLSIVAYTHQFLVMPGPQNQLMVSDDGRFIANNDTQTFWIWDQDRNWGIWRWLSVGLLAAGGCLILRPRWLRRQTDRGIM